MSTLRQLTGIRLDRVLDRLRHPIPGGKLEAAQRFGVDLTLMAEQLRLSPAERASRAHALAQSAESVRGKASLANRRQ